MWRSLVCCFFLAASLQAGDPDALIGTWLTKKGDTVEIYRCGDHYCGRVKDIVEKRYAGKDPMVGQVKVDRENPDPTKRDRPIIGLEIMTGFSHNAEAGGWQGGTIYDPENGKTYKCRISFVDGQLKVRGYIGIPTIGRTELWKRPPAPN